MRNRDECDDENVLKRNQWHEYVLISCRNRLKNHLVYETQSSVRFVHKRFTDRVDLIKGWIIFHFRRRIINDNVLLRDPFWSIVSNLSRSDQMHLLRISLHISDKTTLTPSCSWSIIFLFHDVFVSEFDVKITSDVRRFISLSFDQFIVSVHSTIVHSDNNLDTKSYHMFFRLWSLITTTIISRVDASIYSIVEK